MSRRQIWRRGCGASGPAGRAQVQRAAGRL